MRREGVLLYVCYYICVYGMCFVFCVYMYMYIHVYMLSTPLTSTYWPHQLPRTTNTTPYYPYRDRFLPMPPSYHYLYIPCDPKPSYPDPQSQSQSHPGCSYKTDWWGAYHTEANPLQYGLDCCSTNLISMHYIKVGICSYVYIYAFDNVSFVYW